MATTNQEVCPSSEINTDISNSIADSNKNSDENEEQLLDKCDSMKSDESMSVSQSEPEHDNTEQSNSNNLSTSNNGVDKDNQPQSVHTDPNISETKTDTLVLEKCECLMKRTKISHKWENTYFLLKNTSLYYGNPNQETSAQKKLKEIPLQGAEIAETEMDKKQNVISIKPKDSKRTYYFQANDKDHLDDWLQALCYAKVGDNKDGNSEACVVQ